MATPPPAQAREAVKNAMKHAWDSYKTYAWGFDVLLPLQKKGGVDEYIANGGPLGLTIIDSLDTLKIMGLEKEFQDGRDWVNNHLSFSSIRDASVFEITIRVLGGLLSAYDLSGDEMFLAKAKDLGDRLLPAFESPTGLPYRRTYLDTREPKKDEIQSNMAEVGTLQVEMAYLSHATGNPVYARKAFAVYDFIHKRIPADKLYPMFINIATGALSGPVSIGGGEDSFFEYLLKSYVLMGSESTKYTPLRLYQMWLETIVPMADKYIATTPPPKEYIYFTNGKEHLAAFAGMMFALGAQETSIEPLKERFMSIGEGLGATFAEIYRQQNTGLAPDNFEVEGDKFVPGTSPAYLQRPEVVETLFFLYRFTSDQKYRDWGWEIFQAIDKNCRTPTGYIGLNNVNNVNAGPRDIQETWFLAETLKYLYLLFADEDVIPLDRYLFTTECHPLTKFDFKPMQKKLAELKNTSVSITMPNFKSQENSKKLNTKEKAIIGTPVVQNAQPNYCNFVSCLILLVLLVWLSSQWFFVFWTRSF